MLADFAGRKGITFPLLSDAGSAVIRSYGILNTTVPPANHDLYGIPFPGTFVLDPDGVVTDRFFESAYQERDTVASVMVRLGRNVDAPATRLTASHLELTVYATDQTVAPGTHFSIVLDVTPGPRIHVYAPGVSGYKPIGLEIDPQPGVLTRGIRFPQAEDFYFEPLDEHVPVYQKPFRIVQDVAIDASPQGAKALTGVDRLTIRGTLHYQACDDAVCYTPQSVPLSWSVAVKPLDRERAKRR